MLKSYIQKLIDDETDPVKLQAIYRQVSERLGDTLATERQVIADPVSNWSDEVEDRMKNWGKQIGLSTGYRTLDGMTKGLVGGELLVISGKTSHGKTSLALNIAERVSREHLVYFVTLEMTKVDVGQRLRHLRGKPIDDMGNFLVQRENRLNWTDIRKLLRYAHQNGIELVVIDHLHYFSRELENVAEDLGRVTKEIKESAIEFDLPVILVCHVRKDTNKRAQIDDLRGSSYIAQDADIVLLVHMDEDYPGKIGVTVEKNRNRGFKPSAKETWLEFDQTKITENMLQ